MASISAFERISLAEANVKARGEDRQPTGD